MTWKKITAAKLDNSTWVQTRDGDYVHRNGRWLLRFPTESQPSLGGLGGSSWASIYGNDASSADRWHVMEIKPMFRKEIASGLAKINPGSARKYVMRPEYGEGVKLFSKNFGTLSEAQEHANKQEMISSFLLKKKMEEAYSDGSSTPGGEQ